MHYIVHPDRATLPAWATCAAQQQGKFHEYEAKIWSDGFGKGNYDEAMMMRFAEELKLNTAKFKADMNSDACKKQVADHQQKLAAVGVSGTPAFYINGRFLSGARPYDQFKVLVDEELKKANDSIAAGKASVETYYQKVVLEGGKKNMQ